MKSENLAEVLSRYSYSWPLSCYQSVVCHQSSSSPISHEFNQSSICSSLSVIRRRSSVTSHHFIRDQSPVRRAALSSVFWLQPSGPPADYVNPDTQSHSPRTHTGQWAAGTAAAPSAGQPRYTGARPAAKPDFRLAGRCSAAGPGRVGSQQRQKPAQITAAEARRRCQQLETRTGKGWSCTAVTSRSVCRFCSCSDHWPPCVKAAVPVEISER